MIPMYPTARLYEEMAFIAYHLHWSYMDIMNLEHSERIKWCKEISRINRKVNEGSNPK